MRYIVLAFSIYVEKKDPKIEKHEIEKAPDQDEEEKKQKMDRIIKRIGDVEKQHEEVDQ